MSLSEFGQPIILFSQGRRRFEAVCDIGEANNFLLAHLVAHDDAYWRLAMSECANALTDEWLVLKAREAFVIAAENAGYRLYQKYMLK